MTIPPYQDIDFAIGRDKGVTIKPVAGWAITHPTLGTELFESEDEADRRISEIACSQVKYPMHTSKFSAWIHFQEGCQEGVSNRKHWTPR